MSTAGKVLTVLVTLCMIAWLCLMSMVARLNDNWGQKLKSVSADVAKTQADLDDTKVQLAKLKTDLALDQENWDHQRLEFASAKADLEKTLSEVTEGLERVRLRLKSYQSAVETAESHRAKRVQEKEEAQRLIASAQDQVRQMTAENEQLMKQLDKLKEDFVATRKENTELLRRMGQ